MCENKGVELFNAYRSLNLADSRGIDIGACVMLVKSKKKAYDVIGNNVNRPGTLAEFILLGEVGTNEVINEALKLENHETAVELAEGKLN